MIIELLKTIIFIVALCVFPSPLFANPVPLPQAERSLPIYVAQKYFTVTPDRDTLEGAIFDNQGNLYFCDVSKNSVYRLSPFKKMTQIIALNDLAPGGLAFGPDGRLYMAALNLDTGEGGVVAFDEATGKTDPVIPKSMGYMPNDLVFAPDGGFYFSDFKGAATKPDGGVYYVSPDFKAITPVIPNLALANGVGLSPDGKTLWATEYAANRLHRVNLATPIKATPTGSKIPYHFIGLGPDSMRVDAEGNVYVAMMGQGKVLIFNQNGIPVGQILLPGRGDGLYLRSASLALHPEEKEMYIVSGNTPEAYRSEAAIFSAPALATSIKKE